jgi:TPR repeat protein
LAADQGYPLAQQLLGQLYENGIGVEKDEKEAVKWYRKAANQGLAVSQHNLASGI